MKYFGYYGKTHHRGDFVRYNLPQSFINVWDDWLQQLIQQGEQHHGGEWPALYQQSEVYRFTLSTGIAGTDAWTGLLVPATDKVGRRFPFCLAAALPEHATPVSAEAEFADWFVAYERLAAIIFDQRFQFDSLQDRMREIALNHQATSPRSDPASFTIGNDNGVEPAALRVTSAKVLSSSAGQAKVLHALLTQSYYQYSIWTTSQLTGGRPNTLITGGLPLQSVGLALFDQNWKTAGCGNLGISDPGKDQGDDSETTNPSIPAPVSAPADHPPASVKPEPVVHDVDTESTAIQPAGKLPASIIEHDPVTPAPSVETLELEEDDNEDTPWES